MEGFSAFAAALDGATVFPLLFVDVLVFLQLMENLYPMQVAAVNRQL